MKKYFIIFIFIFLLTGCNSFNTYNQDHFQEYIDELYLYETGKKQDVVYIDLRITGDEENPNPNEYDSGHIKGFINYNYENGSKEEFTNWIKGQYHLKTAVFLIDDGSGKTVKVSDWLKEIGYSKVIAFTDGFQKLVELGEDQLYIVTGLDNCAC